MTRLPEIMGGGVSEQFGVVDEFAAIPMDRGSFFETGSVEIHFPAPRGNGYGTMLFEALEAWFNEKGVSSVNFTSNASRVAAGSLYEKIGYRERVTRVFRKYLGNSATSQALKT